jgi:glycosyltransferase involved in cell wall biosynthesis
VRGVSVSTMATKIAVDGLFLSDGFRGVGFNRYLTAIVSRVGSNGTTGKPLDLLLLVPSLKDVAHLGALPARFKLVPFPAMRSVRWWRTGIFLYATKLIKADALFLPYPIPVYIKPKRLAVTIHDLIPLLFPQLYRPERFLRYSYTSSMDQADLILTDSEQSKADMMLRGVPCDKIRVAPLGFDSNIFCPRSDDPAYSQEVLGRYGLRPPYLLHVGQRMPHKNVERLVAAFGYLSRTQKDFDCQLVLAGGQLWEAQELIDLVGERTIFERIALTGRIPDSDLALLYRQADLFVMPSLYEGFGLPVLEAMASGTPVISSNRSSLPEVAGNAAVYFNPDSAEEIAHAIEQVLTDSALREDLVEQGLNRAKQFSWDDCARKTLAALREL